MLQTFCYRVTIRLQRPAAARFLCLLLSRIAFPSRSSDSFPGRDSTSAATPFSGDCPKEYIKGSSGKWSDATWTHGKQLEQLLQQDTTLRGDNRLFEAHADIRLAAMETTMNNASPWTHFLLISPGVMSWRSVVFCCLPCSRSAIRATARRLLLVVKVVFVVFPNSVGRIGNSTNPITRFSGRTFILWPGRSQTAVRLPRGC